MKSEILENIYNPIFKKIYTVIGILVFFGWATFVSYRSLSFFLFGMSLSLIWSLSYYKKFLNFSVLNKGKYVEGDESITLSTSSFKIIIDKRNSKLVRFKGSETIALNVGFIECQKDGDDESRE